MRFFPIASIASIAALVAACGGASGSTDLFGGATFSGDSDGGGARDGSIPPLGGGSDSGVPSPDGATVPRKDAGGKDAAPLDSGSPPVDAGNDPGIFCGMSGGADVFCAVGTQECCASPNGGGGAFECRPHGASCSGGVPINCDDGADCPGQVCCGVFSQTTGYKSLSCMTACVSPSPSEQYVRFCDPAVVPDECGPLKSCKASTGLTGFYRCE